jgi:hypothetical protein
MISWTAVLAWELTKVAVRYPQTACAGHQKSLQQMQQEWQFLQCVIEQAISDDFLPALCDDTIWGTDPPQPHNLGGEQILRPAP